MKKIGQNTQTKITHACQSCGYIYELENKDLFAVLQGNVAGFKCDNCRTVNMLELPGSGLPSYSKWLKRKANMYLSILALTKPEEAYKIATEDFNYTIEEFTKIKELIYK